MTTIVFPGQGSQFVGMTKEFYENFSLTKEIFQKISDITSIDIKKIIFENPDDLLNQTQFTQLSIFCSSISIFKVFEKEIDLSLLNISSMLGHSLGEYTALTAAGYISIEDCATLLKKRGELMQNAFAPNMSGMAALIGLNCNLAASIIKENNLNVEIANDNSPIQVVISGKIDDLKISKDIFLQNGVKKFIFLNVSAAFHSNLMSKAQSSLKDFIDKIDFNKSSVSIISNYSGSLSNDINTIIYNLSHQMSNRVRWVESINSLERLNNNKIIEIGPGKVLTGLIKRISNKFIIENIETISDIKKTYE